MLEEMAWQSKDHDERVKEDEGHMEEGLKVLEVDQVDTRQYMGNDVGVLMASSNIQCLGTMMDKVVKLDYDRQIISS